jgi:serine protease AprX
MEKNKALLISLLCLVLGTGFTQNKYLILLKDKTGTPFSIDRPQEFLSTRSIERRNRQKIKITQRDLPPNSAYITQIAKTGTKIWYQSRWLNAVLVETSPTILNTILALPFVKGLEGSGDIRNARMAAGASSDFAKNKLEVLETPLNYGNSFNQIDMLGVDKMHEAGFKGEGMLIGIFDSGFKNANTVPYLSHLFTENRIQKTWDFVAKEASVYEDHNHGLNVLSCIAGVSEGQLIGTAPKASFVLFRTEDVGSETRIEEANWLFAAEMADSIGVDVVNSSLGYYDFDNAAQNYKKTDLDGNKALVTRAADWLASTGVLICNSAGNEGNVSNWNFIIAPADADSVLAIAAVDANRTRVSFSSPGPRLDGRIKPDLAAKGSGTTLGNANGSIGTASGTSFSSPLMAGFATGFWQANRSLTNMQIMDYLKRSASQFNQPDGLLGYGIPNFAKAQEEVALDEAIKNLAGTDAEFAVFSNPFFEANNLKVLILDPANKPAPYSWALFTETGNFVAEGTANTRLFRLNPVPELRPGLYLLKISSSKFSRTVRVLKM